MADLLLYDAELCCCDARDVLNPGETEVTGSCSKVSLCWW